MKEYKLVEIGVYRSLEHAESEVFEIPDSAQIVRVQGAFKEMIAGSGEETGRLSYIVTYAEAGLPHLQSHSGY